ncbi:MAG: hypothetical protein WCP24_03175 [bacterium]
MFFPHELIVPNQRRRGLTPKLMSYMSATAGCDREQSEALYYDSTTPPRLAKSRHSSLLKEEKADVTSPFPSFSKEGWHSDDGVV